MCLIEELLRNNGRHSILNSDNLVVTLVGMVVPFTIFALGCRTIEDVNPGVFFIAQDIMKAIFGKGFPLPGLISQIIELMGNFLVVVTIYKHIENGFNDGRFFVIDGIGLVRVYTVS